jgi:hypothetical protein
MAQYLPISVFVRVAGSLGPAALLQHLRFLYQNASFEKDGKHWHGRGAEDLAEGAGLTAKQYRTAMEKLIKAGLVERRHGPHPTRPGKLRVTWFRITDDAEEALTMKFTDANVKAAGQKSQPTKKLEEPQGHDEPAQMGSTNHAHEGAINQAAEGATLEGKKSKEAKKGINSFAAVAASYGEDEMPEQVTSPAQFRDLWVWWQRKLTPGLMVPQFTNAEWGMIKQFLKRCGEMGADPAKLTSHACAQWSDVAFQVQKASNLHMSASPSIPSLLKAASAIQILQLTAQKDPASPAKSLQGAEKIAEPGSASEKFKKLLEKKS